MTDYVITAAGADTVGSTPNMLLGDLLRFDDTLGVACTHESWDGVTDAGAVPGPLTFTPFTVDAGGGVTCGTPLTPAAPAGDILPGGVWVCRLDGGLFLYSVTGDTSHLYLLDASGGGSVTVLDSTDDGPGQMWQIGAARALAASTLIDGAGGVLTLTPTTGTGTPGVHWHYVSEGVAVTASNTDVWNVDADWDVSNLTALPFAFDGGSSWLPTGAGGRIVGTFGSDSGSGYADITLNPAGFSAAGTVGDDTAFEALAVDPYDDPQSLGGIDGHTYFTVPYDPATDPGSGPFHATFPPGTETFTGYPAVRGMTVPGWNTRLYGARTQSYALNVGDLATKAPDLPLLFRRQVRFWEQPAATHPLISYVWTDGTDMHLTVATFKLSEAEPPHAALTVTPDHGDAPLDVTFDGTGSRHGTGPYLARTWLFGDGDTASGALTEAHTYLGAGHFTATLTVSTWFGDDTATVTVHVTSPPTVAPPQRQFPRDDGLGISTRRSWPPNRSVQYGQRRGTVSTYQ